MVNKIMYRKIQNLKRRGFSKADINRETGLNKRTVGKYYDMSEKKYLYRSKIYEYLKPDIIEIYKNNGFQQLDKSAVYDCLEEKHNVMPGKEIKPVKPGRFWFYICEKNWISYKSFYHSQQILYKD